MANSKSSNLKKARDKKQSLVYFGVDEAGRGPLAGPVIACALAKLRTQNSTCPHWLRQRRCRREFKTITKKSKIRDSKQLNVKQREQFFSALKKDGCFVWALGRVGERVIDKINIFEATKLAMKRAVEGLIKKLKRQNVQKLSLRGRIRRPKQSHTQTKKYYYKMIPSLLIDGNFGITVPYKQKSIIKGDEKIPLIALASIVAKVERDRIMVNYDKKYPQYNFAKHKGYATKQHYQALKQHGPCILHRKTFRLT